MAFVISKEGFFIRADLPQRINGWKGIQFAKTTLSTLQLELKSCALPPLERNMKGCKTSPHTCTHKHTYTNLYIQKLEFHCDFLAGYVSFKCQRNY